MNRTTIKIAQESKPEIRQHLIGIVAHQCHETFDIAAQPGSDDRADATVRKVAGIISAKSKHQLADVPLSGRPFRAENGLVAVR